MEFEQHRQFEVKAHLKKKVHYLFTVPEGKKINRVHVTCDCIKYTIGKEVFSFNPTVYSTQQILRLVITPKSYSRKIVIITYTDDTQQFLEFNIVPHETK